MEFFLFIQIYISIVFSIFNENAFECKVFEKNLFKKNTKNFWFLQTTSALSFKREMTTSFFQLHFNIQFQFFIQSKKKKKREREKRNRTHIKLNQKLNRNEKKNVNSDDHIHKVIILHWNQFMECKMFTWVLWLWFYMDFKWEKMKKMSPFVASSANATAFLRRSCLQFKNAISTFKCSFFAFNFH